MYRLISFATIFLFSCLGFANQQAALYQVDIIVFTHLRTSLTSNKNALAPVLAPELANAIPLKFNGSGKMTPYQILPTSASQLRNEYWALNRKPQYQILFHYTWLQPVNSKRPVALSVANVGGWDVQGTLSLQRSNYYLLETNLLFSAPDSEQVPFIFTQKQRMKPGVIYYLDHPHAGMLIKVHQLT